MNSIDLAKFIVKHPRISEKMLGIFAQDDLANMKKVSGKSAMIVNVGMENSTVGHWVAIYRGECTEFFDPLGKPPMHYSPIIDSFLSNGDKEPYIYSQTPLQGPNSIFCGQFVLYFLYYKCHGHAYHNILDTFTNNFIVNDEMVMKFVQDYSK